MVQPRIAVTMGDAAGVGPELCLRLLREPAIRQVCRPIIVGDASVLTRAADEIGLPHAKTATSIDQWPSHAEAEVLDLGILPPDGFQPGHVSAETGHASYRYIEASIDAALAGRVNAVVTAPVNKRALHLAGVPYPGQTEIFADKTNSDRVCMMMSCDEITCTMVTTHVGYRDVPRLLSINRILEVIHLSDESMQRMRNGPARIVVCGLNPHAGEEGLFGDREEERLIRPAIDHARQQGLQVVGPLPPDTAFLAKRRQETDCYVCMYHDQALIPIKVLAFDRAVNITLGLPIIRTSVDHGTALDIAWKNNADLNSLIQAVTVAAQMASYDGLPRLSSK